MFMIPFEGIKINHTEGAAQILKCRGLANPCDDFENNLLLTLRGSVVRAAERSHFVYKLISSRLLKHCQTTKSNLPSSNGET